MKHEEKIHPRQFRIVARHLANPQRPVEALLHVRSLSMLAMLAERIETLAANPRTAQELLRELEPLMREKALWVSFVEGTPNPFPEYSVPTSAIRPSAWSRVIYLPPFYLVHTPGLFEEIAEHTAAKNRHVPQQHRPIRFKL